MHLAAALVLAVSIQVTNAALQASLPEFKSKSEFTAAHANASAVENKEVFYTGKPFEANRDGYLFKYRSYDAGLNRWTSVDPSGFPDGANNFSFCKAPLMQLDSNGLLVQAVYSITSQSLRIGDDDNEFNEHSFQNLNSGDNDYGHIDRTGVGPLPPGTYNIYTRNQGAHNYNSTGMVAYILDPSDSSERNDKWDGRDDGITRSAFRIHLGYSSSDTDGCIVAPSGDLSDIENMMTATSHSNTLYTITSGADTFHEYYLGTLTVVE